MDKDAHQAIHCLKKDLNSLVTSYYLNKSLWQIFKTINLIGRVSRKLKRRIKAMVTLGAKKLWEL